MFSVNENAINPNDRIICFCKENSNLGPFFSCCDENPNCNTYTVDINGVIKVLIITNTLVKSGEILNIEYGDLYFIKKKKID